jgi:pumilio family protein 6
MIFVPIYSKKESSVRRNELLSAVSPSLIKFAAENSKTLLFDKAQSQLFVAIVHNVEGIIFEMIYPP